MPDVTYYEHGFKTGYKTGVYDERRRKDRLAWTKLFALVFIATFFAFASVAALATLL